MFIDKSSLARHVSGNNFAHLQELQTVQYSLWYVVPNTLPVGDLVAEELFPENETDCSTCMLSVSV